MPAEEGLVIPTFGLDPEADSLVLPDLPPAPPAAPKPAPTPTRFDPEGKGPRQGMGFLENVLGSFQSGTIEGALGEAEALRLARGGAPLPETTAVDQGSGFVPEMDPEHAKALRDEARDAVFDQVAYDIAPTSVTPRSVAGAAVGQLIAPSNLFEFGGGAIARGLASRGFGETAQTAARFGAQASGAAAATQDIRKASGARDEGGLTEQLLSAVAGSVLGAGVHAAGPALTRAGGRLAEFVRGRQAQRDTLGIDLPREAATAPDATGIPASPREAAAPAGAEAQPIREAEPARGIPAAEPDPTAPVSREQADGRGEVTAPAGEEGISVFPPSQEVPKTDLAATTDAAPNIPENIPAASKAAPESFEARASRLASEREAMQASGADAAPETRDVYEALGSVDSERNTDPAWAGRHVDEALKVGRADIADHIVEAAERRAVEAEKVASDAIHAEMERDTPGTRYAAAVAMEDAQQARSAADAARRQRESVKPAARQSDTALPEPMPGERFTEYAARVRSMAGEDAAWKVWNDFKIAEARGGPGSPAAGSGGAALADPAAASALHPGARPGEGPRPVQSPARGDQAPPPPAGRTAPRTAGLGEIERDGVFFKDTRGQGVQYHGTSTPDLVPDDGHYSTLNYYGQGFYTTDAADVAFGYSKRGSKQTGERNIYTVRENRPLKIYDAEQPITGEIRDRLGPGDGGSKLGDIVDMAFDENPKSVRELYDHIRDMGTSEGLPADEVQGIFDSINWNLRDLGYDGMSHLGGLRTKTEPHGVTIYFAPQDDITITKGGFDAFHAPKPKPVEAPPRTGSLDEHSPNAGPIDLSAPEPPPLRAATRANWSDLRPATAPDAPAWAPRIQNTFDELARGFGVEPPRLSVGKPRFPDEGPLYGANDRRGNIVLSEAMSEHHALNNAMHEFGHEVQFRLYDAAPQETRDAIQAAFREATQRDYGKTSLNQLRPVTATQKLGEAGQPKRIKIPRTGDEPIPPGSAANYQHGFEEWFAEQVSRWATTDSRPVGVVERFFSGVADAWRKIYERVVGHTPLVPEMKAFLDGRWRMAEAGRIVREAVPAAQALPATNFAPSARAAAPAREFIGQPVPSLGEHRVSVPGGRPIRVAPVVVEASELRTSADAGYDATLQPRQRDRAASQEQIRDIATNLEPARLGVSAEADRGAPIVGGDAMVESGNGRVLAIRRAYEQNGEAAASYRAWLAEQGVDVAAYREPVLVRQRLTGFTAEERRTFTDAANRPATLSMSAPERAMADARVITPDSLDLIRNVNDLGATANRDFVRTFVARLPQAERGAMTTAEGGLSAEGLARVRNAVLAKAYDHAGVLSRIAEATSDDVRSISNALVAAAPDWARLRADIGRGAVRADVDLTGELLEAVARTADLRAKGQKLDTFLDQQDAFDRLPRPVEAFMRMFYDERGRRAASGPVVAERLKAYAGEARKVLADQGLDLGMPAVSAEEIQAAAARRGQRAPAGESALLFSRRQPTDPRQLSFFDRVAEQLRSTTPGSDTKRAGEAADFLKALGTEMADRAGREGAQPGSVLGRLTAGLNDEVRVRPARDPFAAMAGERPPTLAEEIEAEIRAAQARTAATAPAEDSFTAQLARELQAEIDDVARTQRARPDLMDSAETSVVEAASRLHGTPAERRVPVDELRAAVPNLSTSEFERAVVDLHGRGVARFADGAVSLDHAGVRAAQEAVERHVRTEAESMGRELFAARAVEAEDPLAALERAIEDSLREGAPTPRTADAAPYTPMAVEPPPPVGRPDALELRVLRAIEETPDGTASHGRNIWDLRERLAGLSGDDLKSALLSLQRKNLLRLSQYSDPKSIKGRRGIPVTDNPSDDFHIVRLLAEGRTFARGGTPQVLQRRRAASQTVEEPDQIRQGRPVEDQGTAPIAGDARPARLEEMAQRLAADFETTLRTGRVQPGARGQFNTSTGVARVRSLSDLDTALHEIGHSVQQSPQTAALVDPVITRNRVELAPLGAGTGATGDAEAFAELFRLYATNRAYAERTYPGATADLARTMAADLPHQAAALDRLRGELDTLHRADSGAVVGADVITQKPDSLFRRLLKLFGADYIGAADVSPDGTPYFQWRDAVYTRTVSREHPILRAQEALARVYKANTGKTLDLLPVDDAYIRANLASFHRDAADAMLKRGVRPARGTETEGPSFWGAIETAIGKRWTDKGWHDFGAYLTARSMVADYERFAAGELPNPPGKLSAGDYAKAVHQFEAANPTFSDAAQQLYGFQTNLLQRHFDLGLFTKDYYDAAMSRRDYVPKMRDMEDLGRSGVQGTGRRDGASVMKAFRGSQRSVLNPLDAIYGRVHDLERAAAFNETKAALARIAEAAGPGSGFIAEPIPANKLSAVRIDVVDAMRAAGSRANVDHLDLGALIQQAEGLLGDDVFAHIFRQEPIRPGAEPITFYYVNGERRALRLADGKFGQALYNGLNNLTEPERNVFLSVLQISQQVLRKGVTQSIGFIYRNPVRDQFTSAATGGRSYIPFYSAFKGLFDILQHGGDFERYLSFGGFGGGAIHDAVQNSAFGPQGTQAFREKAPWDPRRALGAVAHLAEMSEAATRAGVFQSYTKQAQALGFDPFNSALYATFNANDYVNFRRAGSDLAVLRRYVPFLGAAVQGTDKEARSMLVNLAKLEAKRARGEELTTIERDQLSDARAALVKSLALAAVFGGGTAYLNAENPEWFGAAPWRRHRGYNFFPAGPEGNWATAPKPFGFVRNLSDTFEYGVEYLMRRDPTLLKKWGEALADAHSLPYTNPVIDTFYNVRANFDPFRDRAIVPPSLQALPPSEQYNRYTSEIAKGIGQVTGWSPMKTDYAVKNLGGGTAIDFLRNADTLIHWMQGKPGGKEKTIWDLPLARELVQNLSVGSEASQRFYELVGQKVGTLEQAATAYGQKIATGDRTGAESYLRNLPEPQRAYATLMKQGFDANERLMHPLVLARAYNAVIGGVSRALGDGNLLPEGDLDRSSLTLSRRDAVPIKVDGPTAEKVRNALDALSMVTARNALIAYGAEGLQGVPVKDAAEFMDRIKMLAPEVARELRGRLASKRLYDPAVVAERWPEAKARLLKDGEDADLTDLLPHRPKSAKRERKRALADD